MTFDREKNNLFTSWWWTVDRFSLLGIVLIICVGAFMVTTSSTSVAERIGLDSYHFVKRQLAYLFISLIIIFLFSLLSPITIRRISTIGFLGGILLLIFVLIFGEEVNGARRWINMPGISLQPSEFMKPFFIVLTAWILSEEKIYSKFKRMKIAFGLYLFLVFLLVMQPDMGMTIIISVVWGAQLFVAGLPMVFVFIFGILIVSGLISAYFFFPHVAHRIDSFLSTTGNYQAHKSMEAFYSGGLFGRGPGEGVVKQYLPDSHTDFIFAVAGEELGAIACAIIVLLYAFIVFKGLKRMLGESDLFIVYAVSGLLMQFGAQAIVNMGVALNLLPTKGMTLPFISYGGSSMLAIAIAMGMMLALTRRRYGAFNRLSFS